MRTETQIFDLILTLAKNDERIRAVILNGSRTNPNAPNDIFQDYDIVYIVCNIETFAKDTNWIDVFGKRIILQMPESMRNPIGDGRITYLMLFEDKVRIDLQMIPIELCDKLIERDSLSILLLDKDGIIPPFPSPNDKDYYIKNPTNFDVASSCNDFWWCIQNVAKAIYRNELANAKTMFDNIVRGELHNMLDWYIGLENDFSVSVGKFGKYYKQYLTEEMYIKYTQTYADSNYENLWDSIFVMCRLFEQLSLTVCKKLNIEYIDYTNMIDYLQWVKSIEK